MTQQDERAARGLKECPAPWTLRENTEALVETDEGGWAVLENAVLEHDLIDATGQYTGLTTEDEALAHLVAAAVNAYATARREALEEACCAVCLWCGLGTPVSAPGASGYWHPLPGTPAYCQAAPIRALLDQEPTP